LIKFNDVLRKIETLCPIITVDLIQKDLITINDDMRKFAVNTEVNKKLALMTKDFCRDLDTKLKKTFYEE